MKRFRVFVKVKQFGVSWEPCILARDMDGRDYAIISVIVGQLKGHGVPIRCTWG